MERREGEFKGERGVRIWYQWWRSAAPKAAVVVVHGLGEHSGRYGNIVHCLVPQGYAVYALDHRGHGRSGGPRGHIDRFADLTADLERLIAQVKAAEPVLPVFLLGHSLGAAIALQYALERPQGLAGLIVSSPALRRKFAVPAYKLLLGRLLSGIWPTFSMHSGLPAAQLSHDPQVGAAYVADPLVHDIATARFFTEVTDTMESILANAASLRLPLLVLMSDDDPLVDSGAMRSFFARASSADKTRHEYPGFLHEGFNEVERERPLGDLLAWLEAHLPVDGHCPRSQPAV